MEAPRLPPEPEPATRRKRPWALIAVASGAAVAASAAAIVLGPAGPSIAAAIADGQKIWRLGVLDVEGVGGAALGDLVVERATLADEDGVWAYAEDLRLHWKPLSLLAGNVELTSGSAARLVVLRRPKLAPPKKPSPVRVDTDVSGIAIARLELADGVAGPAATFRFAGAVRAAREALTGLKLDLTRIDAPLDTLRVDYNYADAMVLKADAQGGAGGVFASLLQAPESTVRVSARANGAQGVGRATLDAYIGEASAATGALNWTLAGWRGRGEARLDLIPIAAPLVARVGPALALYGAGEAPRIAGAPFEATLQADVGTAQVRGRLGAGLKPVGAVALLLDAPRLAMALPEAGFDSGGARFDGALEFEDARTRIEGRLALEHAARAGVVVDAEGPLKAMIRRASVDFDADLSAQDVKGDLATLLARTRLSVEGRYDRAESALTFKQLALTGPNVSVRGAGEVDDGALDFGGAWRLPKLSAAAADLRGAAEGQWRLNTRKQGHVLEASGGARGFGGLDPLGQLLGANPKFNSTLVFADGATIVQRALMEGRSLRVGAQGRIRDGNADLHLEASAKGPVEIAGGVLTGAADATGRITGKLSDPRIQAETQLAAFDIAGLAFERTTLRFDLSPDRAGRSGTVSLDGEVRGLKTTAHARLSMRGGGVYFDDLVAEAGRLKAEGAASVSKAGPTADLRLAGALDGLALNLAGEMSGALVLAPVKGETTITLDAQIVRGRFGTTLTADRAFLTARGPLDTMDARFDIVGWATDQKFVLAGGGLASFQDGFSYNFEAQGDFAGAPVSTRGPVKVRVADGATHAAGALALGDGAADFSWRAEKATLAASATVRDAPLEILTAMLEQPAAGRVSGEIKLSGAKNDLKGEADFTLAEARLARRSRDTVNARVSARLGGGTLIGRLDAQSRDGLSATVDLEAPVVAVAAPFRLEPTPGGQGRARWAIDGPVAGLWALFGPLDQQLSGQVQGAGEARFSRAALSGSGRLNLQTGAFEDKVSGVKLRDVTAALLFDEAGMRLEQFSATDGRGGRLVGEGRLTGREAGRLDLTLTNFRLVDRADARATGDGALALEWREDGATLSGEINIDEAEVKLVESDVVAVPTIEVEEINRPGPPPRIVKRASTVPGRLDVRVRAPGRIFTRTRGLDAEWSLDMRVRGDLGDPGVFGEANLVRGDFTLAGRRFELERGEIRFAGDPENAEVTLVAVADTPELTARVLVSGRALDPEITLTSDPVLPEDEILPQLLFGRSAQELSALEAAQLAASLASLAGQSAFDIAGAARAAVDLDRLEVREEEGGVLVAGGKYLTRDVYLEVARGALGQTSTSLEWQVRPRLFIISSFLPNGDQRLALRWRRDY